jgi:MFS transporter, DHA1 family, multidrug resistance protein
MMHIIPRFHLQHWQKTLFIMFFAQLITTVGFSSIFPFLPLYVEKLGSSTGLSVELLSGLVFSSQAFTMMIASPFWGALADRYGRKLMVERAMFGGVIVLLLMAFVKNAEQLVILRAIQGLITGTQAAANALVASEAPRDQAGYAMGILQVGNGAGVALGPLIGGFVADLYGYAPAFYITAAMLLIAGMTVLVGVKETPSPVKEKTVEKKSVLGEWKIILASSTVVVAYSLRFLSQLGTTLILPVAPLFIQSLLSSTEHVNTITGVVVGIGAVTTTISAFFLGKLSDRTGHRRILIICSGLAAVLYFLQYPVTSVWHFLILQGLVGIMAGGIVPAISALEAIHSKAGKEGAVYGLDNSIISGSRTLAPMLGSGLAVWFNLRSTFVATSILFLAMTILSIWLLPASGKLARQVIKG